MGRITIPEPQLQVPVVELPPVGSSAAQAIGQAKQTFDAEAAAWDDRQTQNGRIDAARQAADIQQRYTDIVLRKKANGELKTEDDVTALDNAFQADAANATANASSYAKDPLTLALISTQRGMHEDALSGMLNQQVADRYAGVTDTINKGIQTVATDPTKFDVVYPQLRALLDGYKAPPEQKAAVEKMLSGLGEAAIMKIVDLDPAAAHKILDAGAADFHIDPKELPTLRNKVREAETRTQLSALLQQQVKLTEFATGQSAQPVVITPDMEKTLGKDNAARLQIQIDDVNAAALQAKAAATRDMAGVKTIIDAGHTPDYSQAPMKHGLNLTYDAERAVAPPETQQEKDGRDIAFVQHFGGVPQQVESEISGGLHSQNQQDVLHAAQKYSMLEQADNRYVAGFRQDEKTLADTLNSQIRAGIDPDTAFQNWRKYQSMTQDEKGARQFGFDQLTKGQDVNSAILGATGGARDWMGLLFGERGTGMLLGDLGGVAIQATVPTDAQYAFEKARKDMYVVSGDLKAADAAGIAAMKRGWGVSMMHGAPEVTAFAPEKYYGSAKLSLSQNWSWIHDQAIEDIKKFGVQIPADASLVMTPSPTRRTLDGKPTYLLGLQHADGSMIDIPPASGLPEYAFVPDISMTHAGAQINKDAADKDAAARASAARERQINQWQSSRGIDLQALREDAQRLGIAPSGPEQQPPPTSLHDEPAGQMSAPSRPATALPSPEPAAAAPAAAPPARGADVNPAPPSDATMPSGDAAPTPQSKHFDEARTSMRLSPQEQVLYQHHLDNLHGSGAVRSGADTSTIKQITTEIDGRVYNLPTVWDGKIVSRAEAVRRVVADGLANWPSYKTEAEAQRRYDEMHKFMERDVRDFNKGRR